MPSDRKLSKYHREIAPGVWVDVYDICRAFGITDAAHSHGVKKVLMTGGRNDKGPLQDMDEAIWSLQNYREVLVKEQELCVHDWLEQLSMDGSRTTSCTKCGERRTIKPRLDKCFHAATSNGKCIQCGQKDVVHDDIG